VVHLTFVVSEMEVQQLEEEGLLLEEPSGSSVVRASQGEARERQGVAYVGVTWSKQIQEVAALSVVVLPPLVVLDPATYKTTKRH